MTTGRKVLLSLLELMIWTGLNSLKFSLSFLVHVNQWNAYVYTFIEFPLPSITATEGTFVQNESALDRREVRAHIVPNGQLIDTVKVQGWRDK